MASFHCELVATYQLFEGFTRFAVQFQSVTHSNPINPMQTSVSLIFSRFTVRNNVLGSAVSNPESRFHLFRLPKSI